MSRSESEPEQRAWTTANLQQLFAAMKDSIPDKDKNNVYPKMLKSLRWEEVAFPPFSASECKEKWMQILKKMRKLRSLTELLIEAEGSLSNPNRLTHPEVPKKVSANSIFVKENFAKFRKENPDMSNKGFFKAMNEKFKKLSDQEKAKYQEKSKHIKAQYNKRLLELRTDYNKPLKRRKQEGKEQPEDEKDLPAKPPSSGYNLFCTEQQSDTMVSARHWRDMTEIQKKEYNTRCTEMKIQYAVKLNGQLKTLDRKERQTISKTDIMKEAKRFPGEPDIPPTSGPAIFLKEKMAPLKNEIPTLKERFLKVNQLWTGLSKKEKDMYKEMVKKKQLKYENELRKWFQTLMPDHQAAYLKLNPTKKKYLSITETSQQQKEGSRMPSDSEDEDIDYSSDEEEDDVVFESEEDGEQKEQEDCFMFERY